MAKTIFEELGGKYERQGDYLTPCLTVPAEEEQPIGTWLHTPIFSQAAGSTPTLPTSTSRHRNALKGS